MKRTLKEYKKGDWYEDENGEFHEFAEDLLQVGILGFCCCGRPFESLSYIRSGLELIDEKHVGDFNLWWDGHKKRLDEHFKTDAAMYFFYYWCDKEGLTEHGGGVPGWLTENGSALLSLLQDFESEGDAEEGS